MIVLAAINLLGAALVGTLYGLAATGRLAQSAFQVGLVGLLVAFTALWVRVERGGGRGLPATRRVGRAAGGLALALVAAPVIVLTPLFAIEGQLPESAGFGEVVARAMVLLLLSLAATTGANLVGALVSLAATLARRGRPQA